MRIKKSRAKVFKVISDNGEYKLAIHWPRIMGICDITDRTHMTILDEKQQELKGKSLESRD